MRLIGATCLAAAICVVGLTAQSDTRIYKNETDKNKAEVKKTVEVKDGKTITAVGCLTANPAGGGYMLTQVGKSGGHYTLVTDNDMSKYLDHRVRVVGRAANSAGGKVKIESTTKLDQQTNVGTTGQTQTESTTKTTTEDTNKRFLGIKSVTSVANHCS